VLNRDPWEPFNFRELIKVRSNDELYALMGQPRSQQNGNGQSQGYGGGYGRSQHGNGQQTQKDHGGHPDDPGPGSQQDFLDDDIPF